MEVGEGGEDLHRPREEGAEVSGHRKTKGEEEEEDLHRLMAEEAEGDCHLMAAEAGAVSKRMQAAAAVAWAEMQHAAAAEESEAEEGGRFQQAIAAWPSLVEPTCQQQG